MQYDTSLSEMPLKTELKDRNLNVSIVRYGQSFDLIALLINLLKQASVVHTIYIIDNSQVEDIRFHSLSVEYIKNKRNIGFGRAHNIAIQHSINDNIVYHAVINPDVTFEPRILFRIIKFMQNNPKIGALMPKIFYPNGDLQYLCKLLPAPLDLISKRFFPEKWTRKRIDKFQLKHFDYNETLNVPYLSGCFLILKIEALQKVGLFDERFFLYPEDIDLSRRIHEHYDTVFYPEVNITHAHEQGSYKKLYLLVIHVVNMIRYFNKWGWILDQQRKQINSQTLSLVDNLKNQK
ncbi:glycosyltransferase family 2 protein [Microbacter margulisiae]|uniref:Glycosyltransferase 2-like domain-containing protein n=1 Tax=Microbacter margulisiae TaxID=1350067 RepID=A0A7W5DP57_9PORP|nr:glycosyltransferase family 2 protein [Microbacter margulisiae]MBB3186446.1 hypothetical protein [Microbacter margulisiae]